MPVSEATYQQVVLEDGDGVWELWCGRLVEKLPMTAEHNEVAANLAAYLNQQLPLATYSVRQENCRLRVSTGTFYVPDVAVVPKALTREIKKQPGTFEVYESPVLLVVELWSPSTGRYDQTTKLAEYQRRGDQEVWLIHPYERTLTAWRKNPDGSYTESHYTEGLVQPASLPNVTIELATLFD
jgi:Uma2 family endonuclease